MNAQPARTHVVALAAVLAGLAGCRTEPRPSPAAETTSTPATPAPVAVVGPAPAPAAPIQHDPGTVPAAPKPRAADAGAPPAAAPTIARLATAEKVRQVEGLRYATFVGKHGLVAITNEHGVDLIDPAKGTGVAIGTGARVDAARVSADEALAAVADASGRVTLWDLRAASLRRTWQSGPSEMVFSKDGALFAAATEEAVIVWDTATGAEVRRVEGGAFGLALSAGGKEVVVSRNNTSYLAFDLRSGAQTGEGGAKTGATFGVTVSPDGRFAAAAAPDGHGLQVFDVHTPGLRQLVEVTSCQEHVNPAFSSDSHLVFAYGGTRWIKAFEAGTWKPYASYHARPDQGVASAADDLSRVIVTRADGKPMVVTVATNAEVKLDRAFEAEASYALSADGLWVAGVGAGGARVWSARTGVVAYEEHP